MMGIIQVKSFSSYFVTPRTQIRSEEESWGDEQVYLTITVEDTCRLYSEDSEILLLEVKPLAL